MTPPEDMMGIGGETMGARLEGMAPDDPGLDGCAAADDLTGRVALGDEVGYRSHDDLCC